MKQAEQRGERPIRSANTKAIVPTFRPHRPTRASSGELDEILLKQFVAGDDHAFTALYERYEGRVLTYLRTILKECPDVADDIFQETFLKFYRERERAASAAEGDDSYTTIRNFRGWLFRVAHNLAISHLRSSRTGYSLSEDDETHRWDERLMVPIEDSFANLFGEGDPLTSDSLYEKLRSAVDLLPRTLREVYVLREINGLEYEEVAEAVGCTPEAARMRISRARRSLRKALEPYLPG